MPSWEEALEVLECLPLSFPRLGSGLTQGQETAFPLAAFAFWGTSWALSILCRRAETLAAGDGPPVPVVRSPRSGLCSRVAGRGPTLVVPGGSPEDLCGVLAA